jgi:hypothetical protein
MLYDNKKISLFISKAVKEAGQVGKIFFILNAYLKLHTVHAPFNTSNGLHIFYLIFHCSLYCRAVNITDNLCIKKGNS